MGNPSLGAMERHLPYVPAAQTQVNVSHVSPSQAGRCMIFLLPRDRRLSWPEWLVICHDGAPVYRPLLTC